MKIQDFRDKFQQHEPTLQGISGRFAVLVPLIEQDGQLHLLYEVRSAKLRHHAAEVCFPGGKMEDGESPVQCALRETQEELGIDPACVEVIGQLDFLHLRSEGLMYPVLAHVDASALEHLQHNSEEVQETILVPLSFLQDHPPRLYHYELKPMIGEDFPYELVHTPPTYRWSAGKMEVPVYEGLPFPLWGLTARITYWLIHNMQR